MRAGERIMPVQGAATLQQPAQLLASLGHAPTVQFARPTPEGSGGRRKPSLACPLTTQCFLELTCGAPQLKPASHPGMYMHTWGHSGEPHPGGMALRTGSTWPIPDGHCPTPVSNHNKDLGLEAHLPSSHRTSHVASPTALHTRPWTCCQVPRSLSQASGQCKADAVSCDHPPPLAYSSQSTV